ncbi:MAG: peptidylprolyl isomerase [Clostridia bacterium]|nr:peptidylprolyl isomerase [Clostridia bacterium]
MSKKIKHLFVVFALVVVVALSAALSACTIKTKHPRAAITIEFNNVTYKIEYTLYRNMYPQTVQHFIELADAGFYNDMIVHNYTGTEWYTGGYSYEDADEHFAYATAFANGDMTDYLDEYSKEESYYDLASAGTLSPSVYKQFTYDGKGNQIVKSEDALATLIGEFSDNDHIIKNGALTADYGVLKMYYYSKGEGSQKATIKNSFGQILEHDYKYNAATSIFTIQTSTSSGNSVNSYATFARLRNDSQKDKLDALLEAIADYVDEFTTAGGTFSKSVNTTVDKFDTFAEDEGRNISTSFNMTSMPIIIRSVKITKY